MSSCIVPHSALVDPSWTSLKTVNVRTDVLTVRPPHAKRMNAETNPLRSVPTAAMPIYAVYAMPMVHVAGKQRSAGPLIVVKEKSETIRVIAFQHAAAMRSAATVSGVIPLTSAYPRKNAIMMVRVPMFASGGV